MYIVAICDDDADYREFLESRIKEYSNGNMSIYHFSSGEELVASPLISCINLFFIDIVMPVMDGTTAAEIVRRHNHDAVLVLCSGVRQPAVTCFGMDVYRYILKCEKTHMDQLIADSVKRVYEVFGQSALVLAAKECNICINAGNMIYAERCLRGCVIHMRGDGGSKGDEFVCRDKLENIYDILRNIPEVCFGFPHASYVVNLRYVRKIVRYYMVLESGEELNIAKARFYDFNKGFMTMTGKKYLGM